MAEGSMMELSVVVRAIDYFTGPLRSMMSSITATESKMKSISNTMKLMGNSAAEIDAVTASLNRMKDVQAFSSLSQDLEKIGMAKTEIQAMEGSYMRMAAAQRAMAASQAKYAAGRDLAMAGTGSLAVGAVGAYGLVEMLKQAGKFQDELVTIQGSTGATNKEMQSLGDAIKLTSSQVSRFNDMQTAGFAKQLASGGFNNISQVKAVLPTVAKFAEVQAYEGKQMDPTESVKQAIEMSHLYGHYDPKSFMNFLNTFNKYSMMQPGDSTQLEQTMKYLAPFANALHMKESSSMALAAVDNTLGLSGSHGGTNSADMILRLIPGLVGGGPKFSVNKKTGVVTEKDPKAWKAMRDLGFIDANGKSAFFDSKGGIVDVNTMLSTMIKDGKKYNPEQLVTKYKAIFGQQGGLAANILASPRALEQLQKMQNQLGHTRSIDQQAKAYQKTASGQLNLMKSNGMSIMLTVAQQLAVTLNPVLQKINDVVTATLKFSIAHPMFSKVITDLALLAVGGKLFEGSLKLGFGALKMLDGGFGMLKAGAKMKELTNLGKAVAGLKTVFGNARMGVMLFRDSLKITNSVGQLTAIGRVVTNLRGFFTTASIGVRLFGATLRSGLVTAGMRAVGALKFLGGGVVTALRLFGQLQFMAVKASIAIMSNLAKGLMIGGRYLLSFGATILRTGAIMARWAVGVAADWLIAMGPVGWIIAGVTAVIAGGILAWKTNFLGFRTGLQQVWKFIQTEAGIAWKNIVKFAQDAIKWFQDLPNNMHKIGQNIMQGLANGVKSMIGSVTGVISGVANGVVKTFKNLLGIHSPSKVFMEHGKYIVQGLQQGMESNAYLANRSAQGLANGVVGNFRPSQMSGAGGMSLNGAGGQTIIVQSGAIVIQGGNSNPQELAHMVITELGRTSRKTFMSTGSSMNMGAIG